VGIGPPSGERPPGELSNFVLGRMGKAESQVILDLLPDLTDAIELWFREGIDKAMAAHNKRLKPEEPQ
jgi:peptidyl-tRNA hydrolase